jgi:hypothetical protein
MAQIKNFVAKSPTGTERPHPTDVECGHKSFTDISGERFLQLDTYGSEERAIPGKISQSLQLNHAAAQNLKQIIDRFLAGL